MNKDSTGQNAKFDFGEGFFESREWYRDQLEGLYAIPTKYFATSPRIRRAMQVQKLWMRAQLSGWRDNWKLARHYRRLLKSLVRP